MSALNLKNVHKAYGKKAALQGIDLDVEDADFFVILGPSGAGKTTTLKSVAGLQEIDQGTVTIGGVDMTGVEPYERNVAMAFESYALYPQDTVSENLASPLRSGRFGEYSKADMQKRIEMVTTTLGIDHLLERFPRELSNGQRQRVALGRVLVRPAGIYLLDEPLSHLDAKLRAAMRIELKNLGSMSHTTTLYVTHDHQEALALGDKIAVLRDGVVVQVGTPLELWRSPRDVFVSRALGQPEMNLLEATVEDGQLVAAGGAVTMSAPSHLGLATGDAAYLAVRPREIELAGTSPAADAGWVEVPGRVRLAERLGRQIELAVAVGGTEMIVVVDSDDAPAEGENVTIMLPHDLILVFAREPGADPDDAPLIGPMGDPKLVVHARTGPA